MSLDRVEVLLSMQRALWEQVTPNLRGVAVAIRRGAEDQVISARFLYEGTVGEVERECVSLAETYCIADFCPGVLVTFAAVENAGRELVGDEEWIYMRHEPDRAEPVRQGVGKPPVLFRVVDNFWDLRDDAHDHPGRWEGLTAEALFQRLAECVEEAEEQGELMDWRGVADRMIAWRTGEGEG